MVPAEGRRLGRRLRVLVVALHHQPAAHHHLAALAARQDAALIVHHLEPHQRRHLAATGEPVALVALERLDVILGRKERAEHRRLGLTVGLGQHRAEHLDRLDELVDRHRRRGIDEMLERAVVVFAHVGMGEKDVDQGRRHVDVRHAMRLDRGQDGVGIGGAHEDVGAAEGQHWKRADAGGVGHRRHHQMDRRRLDRHAGPEDRVHGLDHPVGELHALGAAGGAARADQDGDVVRRIGQVRRAAVVLGEPGAELRPIEADDGLDLGAGLADASEVALEARVIEQEGDVGVIEDVEVLLERIARIDRRPDQPGALDAEQGGIGHGMVGAVDCDLVARLQACGQQAESDAMGGGAHIGIAPAARAVMQAVPLGIEICAAVEIIDQPHVSRRAPAASARYRASGRT